MCRKSPGADFPLILFDLFAGGCPLGVAALGTALRAFGFGGALCVHVCVCVYSVRTLVRVCVYRVCACIIIQVHVQPVVMHERRNLNYLAARDESSCAAIGIPSSICIDTPNTPKI